MPQTVASGVGRVVTIVLGAWLGVAAITNAFDLLGSLNVAPQLTAFASGNLALMMFLVRSHAAVPPGFLEFALSGVIVIEAAAALLFLRGRTTPAFVLALALFGAFIVIDDVFHGYDIEASHRGIFVMLCAAYLVVRFSSGGVKADL